MNDDASEHASTISSKCTDNDSFFKSQEFSPAAADFEPDVIYEGSVYHLGVNRLGHHFCHPRFLRIYGTFVEMYKNESAKGHKPIRRGVIGQFFRIEDLGRRRVEDDLDLYVLKISNALDGTMKGEIACKTALDAQRWRDAFLNAKEKAVDQFQKGSKRTAENSNHFDLSKHRPRLRRYAWDLTKLIRIGKESDLSFGNNRNPELEVNNGDADIVDQQVWRCVRNVNGIRILEDISQNNSKEKLVVLKSVGVIAASPSTVFEMLINVQNQHRKEWDVLTGDLKLVETIDGYCDIVYGTFDPKYLKRWNTKRDFVFSRFWRHDPDNSYAIFQSPTHHKDCPKKWSCRRIKLNSTTWEIKPLHFNKPNSSVSIVTQTMGIKSTGWGKWRKKYFAKLDKTIPYIVLCQVAGLREYFAANPVPDDNFAPESTVTPNSLFGTSHKANEAQDSIQDEFYDALAADVEGEDSGDSDEESSKLKQGKGHRFRNLVLGVSAFTLPAKAMESELVRGSSPVEINPSDFEGSLPPLSSMKDANCWSDPGGRDFMVRGKTYLQDYMKVSGGDPFLKLLAVDWFHSEERIDAVASNTKSLVQSEAAKKLPFLLVLNLQVPGTPNYSMVFYFGAAKEFRKGSLLDQFVNGSDAFRDSRFKLIPRIVEGYWFVKRAVGTKACLLGNAVTCRYIQESNYLEIDVDIGSSSVARRIIDLVLGHVSSLVVDMAVLVEGREESELPEYLLGTVRVNHVELQSAKPYV